MSAVSATILDPEAEIAEISGFLNVQHARLVRVVEQALVDGDWLGQGIHTPTQWLALQAGISPARARLVVRVAERRSSFPEVVEAFEAGELTLDQVAEVVKAPAWADAQVLDFAKIATVTQLRRTMRSEFFAGDPDEPDPVPVVAEPTDRLTFGPTGESRWRINGEFDLDAGLRVEAALTEAKDSMFERGDAAATWTDALLEIAETALGAVVSENRRDRYRTWMHVDVSNGSATTTDGWRIPMTVRDRLLCDGVVQPVWERDGAPFSVGRSQRIVPERTRRMIERRDRGCRVPGCTADRFVEIHHIVHWSNGGATDTWNLISHSVRGTTGCTIRASSASPATPTMSSASPSPTRWAGRSVPAADRPCRTERLILRPDRTNPRSAGESTAAGSAAAGSTPTNSSEDGLPPGPEVGLTPRARDSAVRAPRRRTELCSPVAAQLRAAQRISQR